MNNTDFKKHPFEHLKLIKQMNEIEEQWQSKKRFYKNHKRAAKATYDVRQRNEAIESLYHSALPKIKQMFAKLSKYERVMVEINLKLHPMNKDELFSVCFSTFFFDLCCDYENNYFILYRFHNCPIEADIRALMHRLSLTYYCRADTKKIDYSEGFKRILQVQPERFITLL